jgi:hypothetical protein
MTGAGMSFFSDCLIPIRFLLCLLICHFSMSRFVMADQDENPVEAAYQKERMLEQGTSND